MRTKKRAKSVTFGKKATSQAEVKKEEPKKITPEPVKEIEQSESSPTEAPPVATESKDEEEPKPTDPVAETESEAEEEPAAEETELGAETAHPSEPEVAAEEETKKDEGGLGLDESVFSNNEGIYDEGKKKNYFLYFLLVAGISFLLGLVAMAGGYYGYKQIKNTKTTPSPSQPPSLAPSPTKAAEVKKIDRSAFTIKVLNGSGTKGEAARVKELLVKEEFKVTSVGNADKDDYEETQIIAKKTVDKEFLKQLETVLKRSFVLDSVSSPEGSQSTDVVVIVGSSKN